MFKVQPFVLKFGVSDLVQCDKFPNLCGIVTKIYDAPVRVGVHTFTCKTATVKLLCTGDGRTYPPYRFHYPVKCLTKIDQLPG